MLNPNKLTLKTGAPPTIRLFFSYQFIQTRILMIKIHEIQGFLALLDSYNNVGLNHVGLVKVARAAVVSKLLGLSEKHKLPGK